MPTHDRHGNPVLVTERPHLYPATLIPPRPGAAPARYAQLVIARPDDPLAPDEQWTPEYPITTLQMACSCGWRSPLLETPPDTRCVTARTYVSALVLTSDAFYRRCYALWEAHLAPRAADRPHQSADGPITPTPRGGTR